MGATGRPRRASRQRTEPFRSAVGPVENASGVAGEFDEPPRLETAALGTLGGHLDRLLDRTSAAVGPTDGVRRRCTGGRRDDTGEGALGDANEYARAFNATGTVQLRGIAVALGLIRGFDRDGPVVGVNGKEPK